MIHNLSGYVAGYTAEIQQRIAGYQAREDAKRKDAERVRAEVRAENWRYMNQTAVIGSDGLGDLYLRGVLSRQVSTDAT